MKREWVVNILRQCCDYGTKFFFKQWGGVHKSKTGRLLDGRTYDEFPDVLRMPMPDFTARHAYATADASLS